MKFARATTKTWLTTIFFSLGLLLGGCTHEDVNALTAKSETTNTSPSPSSNTTANLTGTAATGAAIVGHIVITDVNGYSITNVIINDDGTFSADVTNMIPPFILTAIPDDPNLATQYSYAAEANITVNVTPLTSLAMFMASNKEDIGAIANHWIAHSSKFTKTALAAAQTQINSNFDAQFQAHGLNSSSYDFFSTPFAADNTSIDAVLDSLSIDIDMEGGSFSVKINNIPFDFNSSANSDSSSEENSEQSDSDTSTSDSPEPDITDEPADSYYLPDDAASNSETWELTITGTVLTAGFLGEVAEMTSSNLSAPATAAEIESRIVSDFEYGTVVGDVSTDKITDESNLVVYEVSFEATGMSYSLIYEYTKAES